MFCTQCKPRNYSPQKPLNPEGIFTRIDPNHILHISMNRSPQDGRHCSRKHLKLETLFPSRPRLLGLDSGAGFGFPEVDSLHRRT
uniref:Ovule protein n=1 Tax=Bursaphelenchus xylophilus TaxID=6326 RepID=A0A1I7RSY6_BURXY